MFRLNLRLIGLFIQLSACYDEPEVKFMHDFQTNALPENYF